MKRSFVRMILSIDEIGAILFALENFYSKDSEEYLCICRHLYESTYEYFNHIGTYQNWLKEYSLLGEF